MRPTTSSDVSKYLPTTEPIQLRSLKEREEVGLVTHESKADSVNLNITAWMTAFCCSIIICCSKEPPLLLLPPLEAKLGVLSKWVELEVSKSSIFIAPPVGLLSLSEPPNPNQDIFFLWEYEQQRNSDAFLSGAYSPKPREHIINSQLYRERYKIIPT